MGNNKSIERKSFRMPDPGNQGSSDQQSQKESTEKIRQKNLQRLGILPENAHIEHELPKATEQETLRKANKPQDENVQRWKQEWESFLKSWGSSSH
jgi:hypothetical protein